MVVALLSGRKDWRKRVHYFAMLGAIGFAFGRSMSYMKTVAYAHSSDPVTVIYGFACLFTISGTVSPAERFLAYNMVNLGDGGRAG